MTTRRTACLFAALPASRWASKSSEMIDFFNFEIGVAFLLPERITHDIQRGARTGLFEAERSPDGPLFPFYTFRMKV